MLISIEVDTTSDNRQIVAKLDDSNNTTLVRHSDLPLNETTKHQIRNVVDEILEFID